MEPTVHGSWPKEFLFCKTAQENGQKAVLSADVFAQRRIKHTQSKPDSHWAMANWAHALEAKIARIGVSFERSMETKATGGKRREKSKERGGG